MASFDVQCAAVAIRRGHTFVDDPSPSAARRTCSVCGRAILRAHGASHVYGSAVSEECTAQATNVPVDPARIVQDGRTALAGAYRAGEAAFAAGGVRVAPGPGVMPGTDEHQPVGGPWSTLAEAWYAGWDEANLAAPIDEGDDEMTDAEYRRNL